MIISTTTFTRNQTLSRTHAFDTGETWKNLRLHGNARRLIVYRMVVFDYVATHQLLQLPDNHQVEAIIAVGPKGNLNRLDQSFREKERRSGRKPIASFVFENTISSRGVLEHLRPAILYTA